MTSIEINSGLVQRYLALQHPLGRWRVRLHLQWQRLWWRCSVAGGTCAKRVFDATASFAALIVLSPLLGLISLLIKLEDGGPVFFPQTRVGQFGREFKMFKIRSMCLDAEKRLKDLLEKNTHKEGVTFKIKNDPRITRVGRWLRKFSFDELPQFYNVLIGDMSVVGPRPPVPREVALYSLADRRRLLIKPGITCIWQICGRAEIDFHGQVELDVRYIETRSFWTDFTIIA